MLLLSTLLLSMLLFVVGVSESRSLSAGGISIAGGGGVGRSFREGERQDGSRTGSEPCHHCGMVFVSHWLLRVQ